MMLLLTKEEVDNGVYYSTVVSCYHIRARECTKYASLLKGDEAKTKCSGIINLLFGVLVDNSRGHFIHCPHFTCTMQLSKYPHILSLKTQNKVYILLYMCTQQCFSGKKTTCKVHPKLHSGLKRHIFHILTSEDMDDIISHFKTVVCAKILLPI